MRHILIILALLFFSSQIAAASEGQSYKLSDGKNERNYIIYRPQGLSRKTPVPLVIVLHGGFGSGLQAEKSYNWDTQAESSGFVVAYPDGIRRSWNAGGTCCGKANRDNVDDVGFISKLIKTISDSENIDPAKVYLTGMSNGAAMSYRYGCEGTYPIAAIGSVAGSFSYSCAQPHHVSVMEIHGLDDHNIPFTGGLGSKGVSKVSWQGVQHSVDLFKAADNCQAPVLQKNGPVETSIANCDKARQVALITIAGAGHQWPGSKTKNPLITSLLPLDLPSTAFDATAILWNFFKNQQATK